METLILSPPVTFTIYLLLSFGISLLSKRLAAHGADSEGKVKPYACGEDVTTNQGQPDYSEFFMLAFFFTIVHVVTLVVATNPNGLTVTSAVYIGVTVLALLMLFRR